MYLSENVSVVNCTFVNIQVNIICSAIKKTFYIQNMTPMVSSFSVELTNFEAVHAKRDILQEVLVDMGYKKMSITCYFIN